MTKRLYPSLGSLFFFLTALALFLAPFASSSASTDLTANFDKKVSEKDVLNQLASRMTEYDPLGEGDAVFIEPEIYDLLDKNGKTPVIIWLKGDPSYLPLDDIKKKVRDNQDKVLGALGSIEMDDSVLQSTTNTIEEELVPGAEQDASTEENIFVLTHRYDVLNGFAGIINKKGLALLSKNKLVKSVYAEKILHTSLAESVPLIRATDVWPMQLTTGNITGTGQTVCVVDTGIDYRHPALGGCFGAGCRVKGGYDFINNDNDPLDDHGHGTHVAGIVAASNTIIKGVAPNTDLIAVKVCDSSSSCLGSAMIAGVDYCVSNLNTLGTDVITMSIGDGGQYAPNTCPTWMGPSLNTAVQLGIPVTVSSGNDRHTNGISHPACSPDVISVGATYDATVGPVNWPQYGCNDLNAQVNNVTCFSNSGPYLDVLAPGALITSTYLNGGYGNNWGGTSMAAPHVAGTIALMKQLAPSLTPFQVESILKQTGVSVSDSRNGLLFPRIDAFAAVNGLGPQSWGSDRRLTFANVSATFPSLGVDAQGNVHITWQDYRNSPYFAEIYYKKLDNTGNTLLNDRRITSTGTTFRGSAYPSLAIDAQGNVHITWQDYRDGNSEIYYEKLDNNGNTLVHGRRLTFDNANSEDPSLGLDLQGNVHIAWVDTRGGNGGIYYKKLDNTGNTLLNDTRLTFANSSSSEPSLGLDLQGNVHVALDDSRDGNREIYYEKLDNNGNALVRDRRLTFANVSTANAPTFPSLGVDAQGNVHVAWSDYRDGDYEIYYKKLDNTGNTLLNDTRLTFASGYSGHASLGVDAQGNVHVSWEDYEGLSIPSIHYKKLDNNGNTLLNDTKLTFPHPSGEPSLDLDSQGNVHLAWMDNRNFLGQEIYYKRSYQNIPSVTLVGNPRPGSTVSFQLNSPLNANQNYILGLALGISMGLNLGNLHIPLDPDFVLISSISNPTSLGISNSPGTLNSNGQATVTFAVPNLPLLSGWTLYGGIVIFDSQGHISGISEPVQIQIS